MFTKMIDLKPMIKSVLKNVRWAHGVNMASAIVTKSSPLPRINYTESFITCPRSISPPAGEGTEIVVVALLSPSSSSSCSSFATSLSLICPPPMHCQLALAILAWREIFQHSQLRRPLVWPIEVLWITPASPWRCSDCSECLRGSWWARLSAACTLTICLFAHSQLGPSAHHMWRDGQDGPSCSHCENAPFLTDCTGICPKERSKVYIFHNDGILVAETCTLWKAHIILYMPLQQFEIALNSTNGLKWAIVGQPSLKARPNVAWMTTWCHNIFKHIWTTCRAYISTVTTINYFENWISNTNMTIVIIIGKSEDKHISFFQCFVIGLKVIGIILELVFSNSLDFRQILTFY